MTRVQAVLCVLACMAVAGCSPKGGGNESSSSSSSSDIGVSPQADNTQPLPDAPAAPAATQPAPTHSYASMDGDLYLYAQALSDDQIKAGQAAGGFVGYKYLGELNGVYMLQEENSENVETCTNPCTVIKIMDSSDQLVDRVQYVPGSIVAAAFADAFNGYLKPSVNVPGYTGGGQ